MKVLPILFNTDMVKAILDGRKTVTRRLVKYRYGLVTGIPKWAKGKTDEWWFNVVSRKVGFQGATCDTIEPPCRPGDVIWVRETWAEWTGGFVYKADYTCSGYPASFVDCWHPSIHMPKEAARIFLRVTDVRVERLQDCGNMQAKDEGCTCCSQFARLWDTTIKPADLDRYGWDANPLVWVIEFERCEKPEGWC